MSVVAGWLDSPVGNEPADAVAAQLLDAVALRPGGSRWTKAESSAGLAISGDAKETDHAADDSCWAAVVGRPRWEHPDYAAIAARSGHARSLIEAFRRGGPEFLRYLRGAFAIAVIDRSRHRALLAIDRLGVHTLCHGRTRSGGLVFGSRTDMVAAHPAMDVTVSRQGIFNYLYFAVSPAPATIYREQQKLLPAQYLLYENGAAVTDFYWRMPYGERSTAALGPLSRELMERLETAVGRIVADEDQAALGAFLSGGLDSSTVLGLLSRATRQQARSFTVAFGEEGYDETRYAEIAARHFRTRHRNYHLTPGDVATALRPLARAFDEPFGNSSAVPAYFCAAAARADGVSLMLGGDGGDEIFAGNSRYVEQLVFEAYSTIPGALRRRVIEPLLLGLPGLARVPVLRKLRSYVARARMPMPERIESQNHYRDTDPRAVFAPEFLAEIDTGAPLEELRGVFEATDAPSLLQRMLHLDLKITLADNDLRKVGVGCALAGVRVAYPFLDDDVVEFSARVPPELLIRRFRRRWFFKEAVKDFLPRETLAKRKHGFGMPFAEWPRRDPALREIARDCLLRFGQRHCLREDFLARLMGERSSAGDLVWDIMMLELWFREHEWRCRSARVAA